MHKINEVEAPVLGNKYLVPCIFNPGNDWLPNQWIPILFAEESHSDPDLGVELDHFHYDTRFISGHKLLIKNGYSVSATQVQALYSHKTFDDLVAQREIEYRGRVCYRTEQLFPYRIFQRSVTDKIKKDFLYTRMENMVCPHKGTCLKGHPVKEFLEGRYQGITCPAHGLSWDVQTGFLIE